MSHEFLSELANHVGECLHEAYPEIGEHIQQVLIIIIEPIFRENCAIFF